MAKNSHIHGVPEIIEDVQAGKLVIIVDDEDRENEGDLMCAAQFATPEIINFMALHARGLICSPLSPERVERLRLPQMTPENSSPLKTAFTVSVEAREGVSTGISAGDRSVTIRKLSQADSSPEDFVRPGHVFPLAAKQGGVLIRAGQTEASVDLCRMAGLEPAAAICEIMNQDGSMARMPDLEIFAEKHGIKILTIEELIRYRLSRECVVSVGDEAELPTQFGTFRLIGFQVNHKDEHHLALVMGSWNLEDPVLVRVHSECLTGDSLGSLRCDCGAQLNYALSEIGRAGRGVLVYLRQEGRGIGLLNKIRAYCLQDKGMDTVQANLELGFKADGRDYGTGAQILRSLCVHKLRLLTNNPRKIVGLKAYGLEIVETLPIKVGESKFNREYLKTKKEKLGHYL
ncbi:MAG: bifunctional 3,4-dihydroxy-2-butanone-4-phosphate synthase/GTP cyclohydrolase II [Candidatus Wallbacteria bacterium]|nr:bifunctional 3,4-dihydroxy-2-butanone-4-phosphate synthase/GTP cyclohydrolase II [Candidatus Wallbacteria bacterium]